MENQIAIKQSQGLATVQPEKATLVEIRTDSQAFPRLCRIDRGDAVRQMNVIILMAFQYRGQAADAVTISQMSISLIDILNEDEYGIGTKFLSFEEIKRVIRKAALGQSKEMYGISVSSLFQALADYCKGEGRLASQQARETVEHRRREIREQMVAPLIESYGRAMMANMKEELTTKK